MVQNKSITPTLTKVGGKSSIHAHNQVHKYLS